MVKYDAIAHQNAKVGEELYFNQDLVASSGFTGDPHEIIGEVEIVYRSKRNGKAVFTRNLRRNDLLVTGAVFLSEKVNQIRSNYLPTPLDVKHAVLCPDGVNRHDLNTRFTLNGSSYTMTSVGMVPYERVCGIMVGRGGCGETQNQIHRVYRTDIEVPGIIPFRAICLTDGQEDLAGDERKLYFMRTEETINDKKYICYYGKRFLVDREINVQWEDGTVVNTSTNIPGNDRGKLVKTFTKYTTSISSKDIREYCKAVEGSTIHSIVNSLGLLTGFPINPGTNEVFTPQSEEGYEGAYEFAMVRGKTTLNTENYPFKDKDSTMDITYRLYFV